MVGGFDEETKRRTLREWPLLPLQVNAGNAVRRYLPGTFCAMGWNPAMKWKKDFDMRLGCAVHTCEGLVALVTRDGPDKFWHISVSRKDRYPTWDEIKAARYDLLPDDLTMAQMLPPKAEYVNVHPNTFHLHEIRPGSHVYHE